MSKRHITALPMEGAVPGMPATTKPELTWILPSELLVDEVYQRDLSPASHKLIRRIVEGWDWRRFKPPVVAWTTDGLEVIDGQHTAIAAATHPAIDSIPVVLVEAVEQVDRAQAFLGHNRDRIAITAPQMHAAAAAAGDEDAIKVNRICEAAGVKVLRMPPARAVYPPRTTIAVNAVTVVAVMEEEADAIWIMRTLADAELAPITAAHIRALQHLVTSEQFEGLDREAVARTIQALPAIATMQEAKEHGATHSVPVWRGLASVWFKASKKRPVRKVDAPAAVEAAGKPSPAALNETQRRAAHAERVEAARRAVPAPTFSRPGGATVKTG